MQANTKVIALPKRSCSTSKHPQASKKKRSRGDRILMLVFLIFLGCVAITLGQQEIRLHDLRQQLQVAQSEREQQLAEKQRLEEELTEVRSDEYIERVARDKLGFLKPGDYIYLVGKSVTQP